MPAQQRPPDFVRLSDVIPDICLDLRYYTTNNFTAQTVTGYDSHQAWLTQAAAEQLKQVQDQLRPWGLSLLIFDAYRPQRAVQAFLDWIDLAEDPQQQQRFYPDHPRSALFPLGYLAARSSHTRGSTVDLSLCYLQDDKSWQELDMGTEFDFFSQKSHTDYSQLYPQVLANRLLLQTLMQQAGFTGFHMEWWHFTLSDEPYPNSYFDFPVSEF